MAGRTALSEEMNTNRSTPTATAASATLTRAEDVGSDRLHRVRLEQRDVLVCGDVEDDLRSQLLEPIEQPVCVADVGERQFQRSTAGESGRDVMQMGFVVVEQDESGRLELVQLRGDLRADRAAGAGDQHPPTRDRRPDAVQVGVRLLPAEQVLDLQIASVANRWPPTQQISHWRQDLEWDLRQLCARA